MQISATLSAESSVFPLLQAEKLSGKINTASKSAINFAVLFFIFPSPFREIIVNIL